MAFGVELPQVGDDHNEEDYGDVIAPPKAGPSSSGGWELVSKEKVASADGWEPVAKRPLGFFEQAAEALKSAGKAIVEHPLQALPGAVEAGVSAVSGLAESAAAGAAGLGGAAVGALTPGDTAEAGWTRSKEAVENAFSKIPLGSETEVGKALEGVLGLIPGAIHASGETVFEKTGSALAGAGTEGLLTLLTLKPGIASKTLGWAYEKGTRDSPSANNVRETFDTLVEDNLDGAYRLADHVDDPKLKKELKARIDEMTVSKSEQVRAMVRDNTTRPSGEVTKGDVDRIFEEAKKNRAEPVEETAQPIVPVSPIAPGEVIVRGPEGDRVEGGAAPKDGSPIPPLKWVSPLEPSLKGDPPPLVEPRVEPRVDSQGWEPVGRKVDVPLEAKNPEVAKELGVISDVLGPPPAVMRSGRVSVPDEIAKIERHLEANKPAAAAANLRDTVQASAAMLEPSGPYTELASGKEVWKLPTAKKPTAMQEAFKAAGSDQIVYLNAGIPVTRAALQDAFSATRDLLRKSEVYEKIEREVTTSVDQLIRNVVPEALGPQARSAAAVIAKNLAEQMQQDSSHLHRSQARRDYWNSRTPESQMAFIEGYERGHSFSDPTLAKAAAGYRGWSRDIFTKDQKLGLKYEPQDNYLYHVFQDSEGVARFLEKKYGGKWNDPSFTKDRSYELYSQAVKGGFKPKFTNPEDIMLARQHASDVATMRVQSLQDLARYGLARELGKGQRPEVGEAEWRSPNGQRYAVHEDAAQILHNAFNTKSLWNLPGAVGAGFRTAMWLKNAIVPIKLALSLFHPLHVATIDNATAMVRASKGLLSGTMTPAKWLSEMSRASMYKGLIDNPRSGYRMLNVWKGKVPDAALTAADKLSLQYMTEGGFVPEMASQYKNNSIRKWKDAIAQRSSGALFHLPFAAMEAIQKPMFEIWIPSLKAASYLNDVRTAMKADPSLASNPLARMETLRKLSKSVDNRYGEMAYNTLFWNRWVKDVGVASTLSMGWNLGFLREYGGAALDVAGHLGSKDSFSTAAKKGNLDRALFVGFYTAQSLAYGGLMTWALTGNPPTSLLDYIYPKTGEKKPDGSDQRVSTMFYAREFAAIAKHMQNEGVMAGLGHLIANKASPVIGLVKDWATNVDYFGREISDPNAPAFKQLEQKLAHTFKELEPISIAQTQGKSGKAKALSVLGFGPAPGYATESSTEAAIKSVYGKYNKTIVPYERAQYSDEARQLKDAIRSGDVEAYRTKLLEMKDKYHLSPADIVKLRQTAKTDPTLGMFKRLTADQQLQIMKNMTPEETTKYRPLLNQKARVQFIREAQGVRG